MRNVHLKESFNPIFEGLFIKLPVSNREIQESTQYRWNSSLIHFLMAKLFLLAVKYSIERHPGSSVYLQGYWMCSVPHTNWKIHEIIKKWIIFLRYQRCLLKGILLLLTSSPKCLSCDSCLMQRQILSAFLGASSLDRLQVGRRQRSFEVYVTGQVTASSAKFLGSRTH